MKKRFNEEIKNKENIIDSILFLDKSLNEMK